MKQRITALLALLLCATLLAGCRKDPAPETTGTGAPEITIKTPAGSTEASADPTEAPAGPTEGTEEPSFDMDAFLSGVVADNPGADPEALCGAILENPCFAMFKPVSTEYSYPGLNWEYTPHDLRTVCCIAESVTGSGALVYAIEPEEGADAEALAEELERNADLNWTYSEAAPDKLLTKVLDGKIFLAMYKSNMTPITGPIARTPRDFAELFHARLAESPGEDCQALADYLAGHQKLTEMYTYPVAPGSLLGFTDPETGEIAEIDGFADGACFNPSMSIDALIGYVFRLEDGTDREAFLGQLREKANLAWNADSEANTVIAETDGSYVLFIMCTE